MLSNAAFRVRLSDELQGQITLNHPIFEEVLGDKPDWALLRMMATQGYQLTKHFLEYVENLFFFCPLPLHKRRLLFNLFEEETGRLSKTKNHVHLMQDFIRAIGVTDAERDTVKPFPETTELIDYRMRMVKGKDTYHLGAAAVMVASEGQNLETKAGTARDQLLPALYGLQAQDLLFFSVHQKEDVGHVKEGIELVAALCVTAEMQEAALETVRKTCGLFRGMYDGIAREHERLRTIKEENQMEGVVS